MTKDNNLTNRITMMIMAAFFIMLMALVPTKKVEAAGGSNFYNAQQIRFNTNYPSTTEPSEGNGYQYFKFRTGSSKATYMIKFFNLDGKDPLYTCLYDENVTAPTTFVTLRSGGFLFKAGYGQIPQAIPGRPPVLFARIRA